MDGTTRQPWLKMTHSTTSSLTSSWIWTSEAAVNTSAEATVRLITFTDGDITTQDNYFTDAFILPASFTIAGCGILTNALSLLYFITRDNKGLMTRIIMLLNSLDLFVCVTGTISKTIWSIHDGDYSITYAIFNLLYNCSLEGTGFTTCLLTVTRSISLCLPYYQINEQAVASATVALLGYVAVRYIAIEVIWYYYNVNGIANDIVKVNRALVVCSMLAIIIVVVTSNTISARMLLHSKVRKVGSKKITEINKRATVTILMLSALFCFFNMVYLSFIGFELYVDLSGPYAYDPPIFPKAIEYFANFLAIPLNSALNPAVYFLRKRSMRHYVNELWDKMWKTLKVCKGNDFQDSMVTVPDEKNVGG